MIQILLFTIILLSTMPLVAVAKEATNGQATVYSDKLQGKKTASGQCYNKSSKTAASSTLPLGSKVLVKNKRNNRSAVVVINDRKAPGGAKLDLSRSAANKLGVKGTAPVSSRVIN